MRIGIDARPLQLDAYKDRGIGTHLRGWIEAAQTLPTTSSFTLLFDPKLLAPRINLTSPHWSTQPFALPFAPVFRPFTELHFNQADEFQFDSALESMLLDYDFDVFHATYTFMWEAYVPRRLYHTRWVVTVYDLIPLVFQDEYLSPLGERGRQSFSQRLGASVYAQRTQTISYATRQDLVKFAGTPADTIDVVYGGIDPAFRPLPVGEVEKYIRSLGITQPYVFSVVGFHHTKNVRRQLQAFSLLPPELASQFQLVVLYPGQASFTRTICEWLTEFKIADRTILLDRNLSQNQTGRVV